MATKAVGVVIGGGHTNTRLDLVACGMKGCIRGSSCACVGADLAKVVAGHGAPGATEVRLVRLIVDIHYEGFYSLVEVLVVVLCHDELLKVKNCILPL